jgi:hypothetical protein
MRWTAKKYSTRRFVLHVQTEEEIVYPAAIGDCPSQ